MSLAIPNRRDAQGHIDQITVLVASHSLIGLDSFTGKSALEDTRLNDLDLRGKEECHQLPYRLFFGIAVEMFCSTIPRQDSPVEICANDGIVRGVDNGC